LKTHLYRKIPCKIIYENIPLEDLIKQYDPPKKQLFTCSDCGNFFNSNISLRKHICCASSKQVVTEPPAGTSEKRKILEEVLEHLSFCMKHIEMKMRDLDVAAPTITLCGQSNE
jgi:hypothetical protein